MAFLDKLNEVTKKVGDKTMEVAKKVGDKAEDAIETGKLSAKISAERFAVQDDLKKIGEHSQTSVILLRIGEFPQ